MSQAYRKKSLGTNVANTRVRDERDWRSALLRMSGAYSANTIRSYRADFTVFEAWCRQEKQQYLPATPDTVADFVVADGKKSAPATVSRRRASIAKIHKLLKLENPVNSEDVNLATRTMYRQRGRRQDQALGLTAPLRQNLIDTCSDDLRGRRDRALISGGYDTLCRRAELVQLRIEDLKLRPDGSGTILVRKSKADQLGHGRLAYLSVDAVRHMQLWIEIAQLTQGPIFRGIQGSVVFTDAMHSSRVAVILKDRAKRADLPPDIISQLSGHSMRVGAAQDMAAAGIDLVAIMHAGGWKSAEMVMRYIEHMDVQKSGMARLHGIGR